MSTVLSIIEKKRDGGVLDAEAFALLREAGDRGLFPFYQEAALLVAAEIRGIDADERRGLISCLPRRTAPEESWRSLGLGAEPGGRPLNRPADPFAAILRRKIDGETLSPEEITAFVQGVADDRVTDAQAAAFCMAVYIRGMTRDETIALTDAMKRSGEVMAWPAGDRPVVDKHSTGGVGDKISLPLVGVLAACGFRVPMISGRGLGFTGGTLDKLESIPGFRVRFPIPEIQAQVEKIGAAMVGQSSTLAPADRRLYAIRDVTGTVSSIPLITASILSKKLAEGLSSLVLDVKTGHGAFMERESDARALARSLVDVGRGAGVRIASLLTRMDDPLGCFVGNALEVRESVQCLRGKGPPAVETLVVEEAAVLMVLEGAAGTLEEARALALATLRDGRALASFRAVVDAQGGDVSTIDDPDRLPQAPLREIISARREGWIAGIHAGKVGRAVVELGGGRHRQEDEVDPAVGVRIVRGRGASVTRGAPVLEVYARNTDGLEAARPLLADALKYSDDPPPSAPLILDRIEG